MPIHSEDFRRSQFADLLRRDHTLNGAVLFGLEGIPIEIQARATRVLPRPVEITRATSITGMASGVVREALQRIAGAFAKLHIPPTDVEILINLAPAEVMKQGTSLDLPLAIIMLQAAGQLPDLSDDKEGELLLAGEIGIHGEVRRIPGALSIAHVARKGQALVVPAGNERESALILAKPGHEGCRVYAVSFLEDVIEFFRGRRRLENALKQTISFEPAIEKPVDFGRILGQKKAKQAALITAAGGHNLLIVSTGRSPVESR